MVLVNLGDVMVCQKYLRQVCSHEECNGHTVYKFSQWCITTNRLIICESVCSCTHSKVSSYWLSSYIKAVPQYSKWLDTFLTHLISDNIVVVLCVWRGLT